MCCSLLFYTKHVIHSTFFFNSMDIFVHMADKEKITDFLQCALTSIHSKQMQEPLKLIQSNWRE